MYRFFGAGTVAVAALWSVGAQAQSTADEGTWSGPYVGAVAGYNWSNGPQKVTTLDPQKSLVDPSGLTQAVLIPTQLGAKRKGIAGGIEAGYNIQSDQLVFGVEADVSVLGGTGKGTANGVFSDISKAPFPNYTSVSSGQTKVNWLGTMRLRAGVATGKTLVFATGGIAFGGVKASSAFSIINTGNPPPNVWTASKSQTRTGYVIGAGVEQRLEDAISVKLEFLHYSLGNLRYTSVPNAFTAGDVPGARQDVTYKATGNYVRVGVNYRF